MARNKYDVAQSGLHALSSIATDMAIFSDSMIYFQLQSIQQGKSLAEGYKKVNGNHNGKFVGNG